MEQARRWMELLPVSLSWPATPVRQFQHLYCLWLAIALMWNLNAHCRFLGWFDGCSLELANKRGLGAHPSKLYGLISPPRLSAKGLRRVGSALICCLLAACAPVLTRFFLFVAFVLSLCYFPQLYAEVSCSGHSTILIPSILFILACSSSLDHEVESSSEWSLVLVRIYLASGYFSSGMCKLLCGLRFNRYWGKGPTLQMYIFDSMWSRPAPPSVRRLQHWLLVRPWLLTAIATGAVLFETGFILAPTTDGFSLLFGLSGLLFHFSIKLLQGLDFVTFWAPALLAFVVGIPATKPWTQVFTAMELELGFFIPAVTYTMLQVLTALTLRDFWLEDILPFSCCPMFMLPRSPYDEWPKWWTMTTSPLQASTRTTGAMEPLYWSPASPVFDMSLEEARRLPQKVVWFGSTTGCPKEVVPFIKPACIHQPFVCFSNFELSAELQTLLRAVVAETANGGPECAWDPARMGKLLALQEDCLRAFDAAVRALPARDGAAARDGAPIELSERAKRD